MATVRNVPKSAKATYLAYLTHKHGSAIPGSDLKVGQGVTFRNKNWSISGSDHRKDEPVQLRLVDVGLSREVQGVTPDEVRPLLGGG